MKKNLLRTTAMVLMLATLSGCSTWNRLMRIGNEPELSEMKDPIKARREAPMMVELKEQEYAGSNSLWRKGSEGFFRDQRASKIGDIVTVLVTTQDNALLENKTEQNRDNNTSTVGINAFAGYEGYLKKFLPGGVNPMNFIDVSADHDVSGEGKIDRKEKINMTMAAIVTQVLGNGNLVVEGTQEIRVNHEVRKLLVKGIVRRADIKSDNTIESTKIAELRVSYGGDGVISDMQEPRYGRTFLDAISPF